MYDVAETLARFDSRVDFVEKEQIKLGEKVASVARDSLRQGDTVARIEGKVDNLLYWVMGLMGAVVTGLIVNLLIK